MTTSTTFVHDGWDGRSRATTVQSAPCGCTWTVDGKSRLHVCLEAIQGTCESEPIKAPEPRGAWGERFEYEGDKFDPCIEDVDDELV